MQEVTVRPVILLQWRCPKCEQLNSHNGKKRLTDEQEAHKDRALAEAAEVVGIDPEDAVMLILPNQVWCCKCGEEFEPRPDPDDMTKMF